MQFENTLYLIYSIIIFTILLNHFHSLIPSILRGFGQISEAEFTRNPAILLESCRGVLTGTGPSSPGAHIGNAEPLPHWLPV
jgi:hypothetical protein